MPNVCGRMTLGAVAGLTATGPMTLFMEALHPALPVGQRDPLPPRQITERAAAKSGVANDLSATDTEALTEAAHFGFGATTGAAYGALAPALPFSPAVNGVCYGLGVWAASYLGWLPAAGLYRPPTREPVGRHALMIGAHVIWGAVLGWMTGSQREEPVATTHARMGLGRRQ